MKQPPHNWEKQNSCRLVKKKDDWSLIVSLLIDQISGKWAVIHVNGVYVLPDS